MRLVWIWLGDVSRDGTSNQFSAPWPAEIRLGWVRESDVSSGRQALQTHFLPFDQSKMQLRWGRESIVSRARMAPWTEFRPLTSTKCYLNEVDKALFQEVDRYWEFIFCLFTFPKCDFCEIKIQEVEWLFVLFFVCLPSQNATCLKSIKRFFKWSNGIFCLLSSPKCDVVAVEKAVSSAIMTLWNHFRSLDQLKFSLWWVRESDVSSSRPAQRTHFQPLEQSK